MLKNRGILFLDLLELSILSLPFCHLRSSLSKMFHCIGWSPMPACPEDRAVGQKVFEPVAPSLCVTSNFSTSRCWNSGQVMTSDPGSTLWLSVLAACTEDTMSLWFPALFTTKSFPAHTLHVFAFRHSREPSPAFDKHNREEKMSPY